MKITAKITIVMMSAAFLLIAVPAFASDVNETRDMNPDGRLSLVAPGGRYTIIGVSEPQLNVHGTLGAGMESLQIAGDPAGWQLRTRAVDNDGMSVEERADLTIRIPRGASLEISGDRADISVRGMAGQDVQVRTVSGRIDIAQASPMRLQVETVSGRVDISSSHSGELRLQTVSGDIDVRDVAGRIQARSVSGNLSFAEVALDSLYAEVVSGRMHGDLKPSDGSLIQARSHTGAMQLNMPLKTPLDLQASTISGRIHSDFGGTVEGNSDSNRHLRHRTGNGSVRAELASFSGPIEVFAGDTGVDVDADHVRVLIYRENVSGYRHEVAHLGVDDQVSLQLAADQFALTRVPVDSRELSVRASQSSAYRLEVESWGADLNCFKVVPERGNFSLVMLADIPGQARQQLHLFELEPVACPEPELLEGMTQVE